LLFTLEHARSYVIMLQSCCRYNEHSSTIAASVYGS